MRITFHREALDDVLNSDGVQKELEKHAKTVANRAQGSRGTSDLTFRTRRGKSRKGAFAQTIMRGDGALAVEFGSRNNEPLAPLRNALKGL